MSRPIWQADPTVNEIYIPNGSFENVPGPNNAATNQPNYWINGVAGGDIRDGRWGWWLQGGGAGATARFDQTTFYDGGSSMLLYISTLTGTDCVVTNYPGYANVRGYGPPLKPSTTYRYTYWMKTLYYDGTTQVGNGATLQACVRDSSGSLKLAVTPSPTFVTSTTDWTFYSGTFTTPAIYSDITGTALPAGNYGAGYFYTPKLCIFNNTGSSKDIQLKAWFDNLRLYEVA